MLCEVCNEEEATVTLIPVGEGMPQSIGAACFARFGLEAAKANLPAEEIAASLGPMFVGPAVASRELDTTPKRSARKAKPKAELGAQPDLDGDPPEGDGEDGAEAAATEAG
jgi:hypothetical protein